MPVYIVCVVFYFLQQTILSILSEKIFIKPLKIIGGMLILHRDKGEQGEGDLANRKT